jgi:drug/metabolite transporter (DMT)-like permease
MAGTPEKSTPHIHVQKQDWYILMLLSLVWGSSFILIKKGLLAFTASEMALLRIEITSLVFVPIYFLMAKGKMSRRQLFWAMTVGVLGSGLPAFLFAIAETSVPSSIAGMLNSLTPIFTWVLGLLFFKMVYTRNQLLGVTIGFVGAIFIIAFEPDFTLHVDPFTLFILAATISYALSANIVKTHLQCVHHITLSSIAFIIIGIPAFIYSFQTDMYIKIPHETHALYSLAAIVILSLFGTVLANILFYRLIQRTNQIFASTVAYLIPVMALGWGLIDGESLQWTHFSGMVFILLGVWFLRKK